MDKVLFVTVAVICLSVSGVDLRRYEPTWESLDTRPIPQWFDDAKIGIFIHWGVFSVPCFKAVWFWYYWQQGDKDIVNFMKKNYPPGFTYADFAPKFTTEFYNAEEWADMFNASGARYVVLVSKHHEGYTNWPSKYSWNWNSMDVGPHKDLTGELASAIRKKTKLHFGLYHSLFEFFHPLYLQDKRNNFKTQKFVKEKTGPELYEIVNKYKPEYVWSDGQWEALSQYWNSTQFLAWLYNESPVKDIVVTNDRWGNDTLCKHGGVLTCNDRYNPKKLVKRKWENSMTLDRTHWGCRKEAVLADFLTMDELIQTIAETVSCNGNILMNVAPTWDGRIPPIYEERLRQLGSWLKVNGEGIYSTKPWSHQNDTITHNVWYTSKKGTDGVNVYAIVLDWPKNGLIRLGAPIPTAKTKVEFLGYDGSVHFKATPGQLSMTIDVSFISFNEMPCDWAWTFKLTHLSN